MMALESMEHRKLFVSYSRRDKAIVDEIRNELNLRGYTVWIDQGEISPGEDIVARINKGLDEAKVFVAFVGDNYFVDDKFTSAEFGAAFYKAMSIPRWKIIVVKLKPEIVLPPLVASRLYITYSTATATAQQIAQAIRGSETWDQTPSKSDPVPDAKTQEIGVNFADISDIDLDIVTKCYLDESPAKQRETKPLAVFDITLPRGRVLRFSVIAPVLSNSGIALTIRDLKERVAIAARFVSHFQAEIDEGFLGKFGPAVQMQLETHQTRLSESRSSLRAQFEEIAEKPTLFISR